MNSNQIVVNPKYESLREFVTGMPKIFDLEGCCIYDKRNRIKYFNLESMQVNVKRYCVPPFFFNRIIYRLFREPKAQRAFEYAIKLRDMGIETPMPIAYILEGSPLLLGHSYFVSEHDKFTNDIGDYEDGRELNDADRKVLREFGEYTALLHNRGVYHKDYGRGNVLFNIVDGVARFSLLDINRMEFGDVSFERGCANFVRIRYTNEMFREVAEGYAKARGFDAESTYSRIIKLREERLARGKRRLVK